MASTLRRYLVCYDISDPKRLRRIAKTLESYGTRIQYSVFECPLDDLGYEQVKAELNAIIQHTEDQVLFVSLGSVSTDANLVIESKGRPYLVRTRVTII